MTYDISTHPILGARIRYNTEAERALIEQRVFQAPSVDRLLEAGWQEVANLILQRDESSDLVDVENRKEVLDFAWSLLNIHERTFLASCDLNVEDLIHGNYAFSETTREAMEALVVRAKSKLNAAAGVILFEDVAAIAATQPA